MYDLRNVLKQQPVAIAGAVKVLLHTLVLAGVLVLDAPLLSGISLAVEVILNLFVWNAVTPTSNIERHPEGDPA
jgi:hypothetical protein